MRSEMTQDIGECARRHARVFDKTNMGQAGSPPRISTGYAKPYVAGYDDKLWGLRK